MGLFTRLKFADPTHFLSKLNFIQMTTIFKREDWTLFQTREGLAQKAGTPPAELVSVMIKELVDNALDAGANAQLEYDQTGFTIIDDGQGIPGTDQDLKELFSINRPLSSSKIVRKPSRGALGNGLRVVAGAMWVYSARITVETKGRRLTFQAGEDGKARIIERAELEQGQQGTRVTVISVPIEHTDVIPGLNAIELNHGTTYSGKTSLYWYNTDSFHALLKSVPEGVTLHKFLSSNFDGCTGTTAGYITADYHGRDANTLSPAEADNVLQLGREYTKQVSDRRIGKIGQLPGQIAYSKSKGIYTGQGVKGDTPEELPYIVEVWAMPEHERNILAVNKTPVIGNWRFQYQEKEFTAWGCNMYFEIKKRFKGKPKPAIWVNVTTPHMKITTDGKEPDLEPIEIEIETGIRQVIKAAHREANKAKPAKRSQREIITAEVDNAVFKISKGGAINYTLRQLFYNIRPAVLDELAKNLDYNYFCQVITDIEGERGEDLPNMLRDDRGIFLHPHDGQETPLGTAAIEKYSRPEYQFNKVLYIEKRGLFQILKEQQIPQRYDLALMSAAGYANRAARDLIDMLGESGEPIQFFCVHDADASGTMIYQTLTEATKARGARQVQIIDFGLHPAEALEMGLQVEKPGLSKTQAVAQSYHEWADWLQSNRVELDAMPPELFIEWIEDKLSEYHTGKLIPPADYLQGYAESNLAGFLRDKIAEQINAELQIDDLIEERFNELHPEHLERLNVDALAQSIGQALQAHPAAHWETKAEQVLKSIVELEQ